MKSNGAVKRKLGSWVDAFVEYHDNLDSPEIFRRWSAITALAAVVEQKVWLTTSSILYPNLYTFLVGHPGVGKTRTVRVARAYAHEIPEFHLAPTSMTSASLVDSLVDSRRHIVRLPDEALEYNSMTIMADEIGAFIHKYETDMISLLSAFYDPDPYGQTRRGKEIKIKIKRPQLNILAGSTPSNLMQLMPEGAWDQGYTSRIMLIYSDERIAGDDFARVTKELSSDLLHDLKIINTLVGQYSVTQDYKDAVANWRALGEPDVPGHPKLIHYVTRRRAHLYKLSMLAALDRSNTLLLTKDDFNRALGWLLQAEAQMADTFKAGSSGADGKVMDDLLHIVQMNFARKRQTSESVLVNEARKIVPAHSVMRVLEIMERSRMVVVERTDSRTGVRYYGPGPKAD